MRYLPAASPLTACVPIVAALLATCLSSSVTAQDDPGAILISNRLLAEDLPGPDTPVSADDFGHAATSIGDLDGDGVGDLAVLGRLAMRIVYLNADDSPRETRKIDLSSVLNTAYASITCLGDVNGDGVQDLALGSSISSIGAPQDGAVVILFLAPDGSLLTSRIIGSGLAGFGGVLADGDSFGDSVAGLGDLDGDGIPDLAVSAPSNVFPCDTSTGATGTLWILFLDSDGTVKGEQAIGSDLGGLQTPLAPCARFGDALSWGGRAGAGGKPHLALGGNSTFWDLSLNSDGTVATDRSFTLESLGLEPDFVGQSVSWLGDIDHDGVDDLAFARRSFHIGLGGPLVRFRLWVVMFHADGSLKRHAFIDGATGGYTFPNFLQSGFPRFLTTVEDRNGDGVRELLGGAAGTDLPKAFVRDQVTIMYLNDGFGNAPWKLGQHQGVIPSMGTNHVFGSSLAELGDLDGDGRPELAVGSPGGSGTNPPREIRVLSLEPNGAIASSQLLSGDLAIGGGFGSALGAAGDVNDDGVPDLVAGRPGQFFTGAADLFLLNSDGSVATQIDLEEGFPGLLEFGDKYGSSVAGLGDLDGDGVEDLAVGAPSSPAGGPGAVWILFLDGSGTVKTVQRISAAEGGFDGLLDLGDAFGAALAVMETETGGRRLLVGAPGDDDGGLDRGAVWVLELAADGTVSGQRKLSANSGGFPGRLHDGDAFGSALAVGPMHTDGLSVVAVGAPGDDVAGTDRGAVWILWPARSTGLPAPFVGPRVLRLDAASKPFSQVDIDDNDALGTSLAWLGDLDADGAHELAVGAPGDDDLSDFLFDPGPLNTGAVWIICPALSRWSNLGLGLAGSNGIPQLVGRGSLLPGDEIELHLTDALPGSSAALVAGTARADIPFMGGVLVPRPDRVILGLPVDDHGTHTYRQVWRAPLPQLVAFHFQFLVLDPGSPMGVSASNAVVAKFP